MRATDENLLTVHVVTGDVAHRRRLHTANEMIAGIGEVAAGVLTLMGAGQIAMNGEKTFAMYGAQLATLDIVMLFFGQRIAKDYAGAASLVPYFILCVGQVMLLTQ